MTDINPDAFTRPIEDLDPKEAEEILKAIREIMPKPEEKVIFEQEHRHDKVYEPRRGNLWKILKEFTQRQFVFGAVTMNILKPDGSTGHWTVRLWGTKRIRCKACQDLAVKTWLMADEGWAIQCSRCKNFVLGPLSPKSAKMLEALISAQRMGFVDLT